MTVDSVSGDWLMWAICFFQVGISANLNEYSEPSQASVPFGCFCHVKWRKFGAWSTRQCLYFELYFGRYFVYHKLYASYYLVASIIDSFVCDTWATGTQCNLIEWHLIRYSKTEGRFISIYAVLIGAIQIVALFCRWQDNRPQVVFEYRR